MNQLSLFDGEQETNGCSCEQCRHYSALREPRQRSDEAVIYGYCFKDGDKSYNTNMGKGLAVFIPNGDCKHFKKRKEQI